jgi:hypothetical protein
VKTSLCLPLLGLAYFCGLSTGRSYDVLTNHNDVARTGLVTQETILSVAYFNNSIYSAGKDATLKRFHFNFSNPNQPLLNRTPAAQTSQTFAFPGFTPSISANGTQMGSSGDTNLVLPPRYCMPTTPRPWQNCLTAALYLDPGSNSQFRRCATEPCTSARRTPLSLSDSEENNDS